jgi:hypothetical protein
MTTKLTPTKDQREFAAYVRAMKKAYPGWVTYNDSLDYHSSHVQLFRAGVAHGRRERSKAK